MDTLIQEATKVVATPAGALVAAVGFVAGALVASIVCKLACRGKCRQSGVRVSPALTCLGRAA